MTAPTRHESHVLGSRCILAIDTSQGTSVACGAYGSIWSVQSVDPRGHAEKIGDLVERVLQEAGVAPSDIEYVIAGTGPGLFTGLRVGLAFAETFAFAADVPIYGISSHAAVALPVLEADRTATVRVVQDAKRKELFCTAYTGLNGWQLPEEVEPARVISAREYSEQPGDLVTTQIDATHLITLASRALNEHLPLHPPRANYLRAPDVQAPGAPKRVST